MAEKNSTTPRYDISIYNTSFSELPDPKRVWIGEPGSALEGIGKDPFTFLNHESPDSPHRTPIPSHTRNSLFGGNFRDQDG